MDSLLTETVVWDLMFIGPVPASHGSLAVPPPLTADLSLPARVQRLPDKALMMVDIMKTSPQLLGY